MEDQTSLADYFSEEGAKIEAEGERFMTSRGEVYACLGFTSPSEGGRMKIRKEGEPGSLEELVELVEVNDHLKDSRVVTELVAGKFYEQALDKNVLFYDGESLISEDDERISPEQLKGLRPIEDEDKAKYIEALEQRAYEHDQEGRKLQRRADFIQEYSRNSADERGDTDSEATLEETEPDSTDLDTSFGSGSGSGLGDLDEGEYEVIEENTGDDTDLDTSFGSGSGSRLADSSVEASLEDIEEDVNLDSFGSDSGLLDLELQADDTSLGGILDEIYTAEGGEGTTGPAEEQTGEAETRIDDTTAEAGPEETTVYGAQPPIENAGQSEQIQVVQDYSTAQSRESKPEGSRKPKGPGRLEKIVGGIRSWLRRQREEIRKDFF